MEIQIENKTKTKKIMIILFTAVIIVAFVIIGSFIGMIFGGIFNQKFTLMERSVMKLAGKSERLQDF